MTVRREALSGCRLDYTVKRSRRRTLAIHVRPGPVVEVRAPRRLPDAVVHRFVAERSQWIRSKLEELDALPAPFRPTFQAGEPHPYLGVSYPLELLPGSRGVRLSGECLRVGVAEGGGAAEVERALNRWYRRRAWSVFGDRLDTALERLASWRLPEPRLGVRVMRRRWGSCSSAGKVTLNLHLIKMPIELLDYVICHELCHLLEMNHSPRFYALMDAAMPGWRTHRHALREYGSLYLG